MLGLVEALEARCDAAIVDVGVPGPFKRQRWLRPALSPKFVAALGLRLALHRPDLVHVHTADYAGFWEKSCLAALAHLGRRPYVMHLHGGTFDTFLGELSGRRARLAARILGSAACVVVPAEAWRPVVARFAPAEHVEVLPNAIRFEDFAGPRPLRDAASPPCILFLGMISARKGLDELLQAVAEIVRGGTRDFRLDIVGGEEFPGETERYRRLFHAAQLDPWVTWHGPAFGETKRRFLLAADVFVLPSRSESFGIANLEAMAAGSAVVSTRTGAVPEYLAHGVQGLLVEPGDAPALAAALLALLGDAELRRRLGEAARARARDFDWGVVAPRVAALYERVLAERRG